MKLSIGKLLGLQQVADDNGFLTICAVDHRGALKQALNKEDPDAVSYQDKEFADMKPRLVIETARQITALSIDVLKAEFPADIRFAQLAEGWHTGYQF